MRLRDEHDGHSVYVLYSDLLFNLVIVFLLVVLALVLRLNHGMNRLAEQRAASAAPPPDRTAEIKRLTDQRDGNLRVAVSLRERLAAAEQRLADASAARDVADAQQKEAFARRLSIAAGANRFTGRTGGTSLCVAMDYSGGGVRYVLVNASDFGSAHSTLNGETPDEHAVRSARLLTGACRGATRFAAEDLRPLFAALRTRLNGDKSTDEGHVSFGFSARASAAASGWLGADGDIDKLAALRDLRRLAGFESLDQTQSDAIGTLIRMRDAGRRNETPESVPVLHFTDAGGGRLGLGGAAIAIDQFKEIVASFGDGGVILQYDAPAGQVCPPWVVQGVLTPVGYTNSVPDLDELRRLRQGMAPARP